MNNEVYIAWNDSLSIGDLQIDEQHKKLIDFANTALNAQGQPEISQAIMALYKYVRIHFTEEEQIMEQRGYKDLLAHKILHEELITRLNDLPVKAEFVVLQAALHELIFDWVLLHIQEEDVKIPLH